LFKALVILNGLRGGRWGLIGFGKFTIGVNGGRGRGGVNAYEFLVTRLATLSIESCFVHIFAVEVCLKGLKTVGLDC
jgi:hypothetical protein